MWGSGGPGREEQGLAQGKGPGHEGKRLRKWVSPRPRVWVLKKQSLPILNSCHSTPNDLIPSRPVGQRGQGREVGVGAALRGGGHGKRREAQRFWGWRNDGGRRGPAAARPQQGWAQGGRDRRKTPASLGPGATPQPRPGTGRRRRTPGQAELSKAPGASRGGGPSRTETAGHTQSRREKAAPGSEAPGSEAPAPAPRLCLLCWGHLAGRTDPPPAL